MDDFETKETGFSDDGEDIKMFTIEVYKLDKRTKSGRRLLNKYDHQSETFEQAKEVFYSRFPIEKGFLCLVFETYVTRKNLLSGKEYKERYDTPIYCSPSSESYWSM